MSYQIWLGNLVKVPTKECHGKWIPTNPLFGSLDNQVHKSKFILYGLATCTAFLPGHNSYWITYKGMTHPTYGTHTLCCSGPTINLPHNYTYAHILLLHNRVMVLNGFAPYKPTLLVPSLPSSLLHSSIHTQQYQWLIQAIQLGMAPGISDESYMPKNTHI